MIKRPIALVLTACLWLGCRKPAPPPTPDIDHLASALQDAIRRHDRATVAALVRYPLRVHTTHCLKHLATPKELLAHYSEVFPKKLEDDILAQHPPFFTKDDSFALASGGQVWAWATDDKRFLVGGVFAGSGDVKGVPCADREIKPIPDSVWGTWMVTSIRQGELESLNNVPWNDMKRLTLSLDRATNTMTSRYQGHEKTCKVLWYARDTSPEPPTGTIERCTAFEQFWGPNANARSHILEAECPGGGLLVSPPSGMGVLPELIVLDDALAVIRLGCDGIAILEKPREPTAPARTVPRGGPCGTLGQECEGDARCVAVSARPLDKRCKGLDEPAL